MGADARERTDVRANPPVPYSPAGAAGPSDSAHTSASSASASPGRATKPADSAGDIHSRRSSDGVDSRENMKLICRCSGRSEHPRLPRVYAQVAVVCTVVRRIS
jgi:hypothetical protein